MILLTDGEDQGSQMKVKDAIEAAQKADSICYVILIADRSFYWMQGAGYGGAGAMKKLAEETGGRVIEVGNKRDKLKQAFDQIANELRSQYNIGYTPINSKHDGTFRKVEIQDRGEGLQNPGPRGLLRHAAAGGVIPQGLKPVRTVRRTYPGETLVLFPCHPERSEGPLPCERPGQVGVPHRLKPVRNDR